MKSWIKMMVCLLGICVFILVAPMVLSRIDSYRLVINHSEKLGIDNSALFYTEEQLTSTAEQKILEQLNNEKKN